MTNCISREAMAEAKCTLAMAASVCLFVLSVPRRIPTLLYGPGCNLGNGRGCPLVVHYWVDLRCTGFVAMTTHTYVSLYRYTPHMHIYRRTQNASECLYSLYGWLFEFLLS